MSDGFEGLSRSLGRRSLLKAAGVGAIAFLARPFRASAVVSCAPGQTPCGGACCPAGVSCANPATSTCGCPRGQSTCGTSCCEAGSACSQSSTSCCCARGTVPCGPTCCATGVSCLNAQTGICGCPRNGSTQCYDFNTGAVTCCPPGKQCGSTGCVTAPTTSTAGCCRHYADTCTANNQCCTGFCSSYKSGRCGCVYDVDCPSSAPHCDRATGVCEAAA